LIITLKHSNHWTKITTKNNHECIIHRTLGSVWCDVMVVSTCIIAMLYYGSDGMGWEDGWYWHCVVGKWSIIRPFRLAMVAFTHHWVGIIHLFPFPFSFIVNTYLNAPLSFLSHHVLLVSVFSIVLSSLSSVRIISLAIPFKRRVGYSFLLLFFVA
jgi:hypothetical protein